MVSTGTRDSRGIAERICGSIASLQSHLMQTHFTGLDEEIRIQFHSAIGVGVDTDHPALEQVGIELVIPGAVQAICYVDALGVPANLDHLGATQQPTFVLGVSFLTGDTADLDLADELWIERIRNIILMEFAGSPAGNIQEAVV